MIATPPSLRDWLETQVAQLVAGGTDIRRPQDGDGAPNEKITDWLIKINALMERLPAGVTAATYQICHWQQHSRRCLQFTEDSALAPA